MQAYWPRLNCGIQRFCIIPRIKPIRSRYFSSRVVPHTDETVQVPVGGNGTVSLDIYSLSPSVESPVILYLPSGPLPAQWPPFSLYRTIREKIASSNSPCTLVSVNYRLDSSRHYFPTPVHDILAGFDWILANIYHSRSQSPDAGPSSRPKPGLSIYGSFIGAGLATMLSLTEPRYLDSVNLVNPITDWVGLDDKQTTDMPGAKELILLRDQLFQKPEEYFDPFASSLLFLRSPGRDVPKPPEEKAEEFDTLAHDNASKEELSVGFLEDNGPAVKAQKRKAMRHWPPAGTELRKSGHWRVPWTRFWVMETDGIFGRENIFRAQAEELARLLRRNYMVNYKGLVNEEEARTRIDLRYVSTLGDMQIW